MKKFKGIGLAIRLALVAIIVIATFGFIAQPASATATVNEVISPNPTDALLNTGGTTELIWWSITGYTTTPYLVRHIIQDPSGAIVDQHDFPVVGGSPGFPPTIFNPEDTFSGTVATVTDNQHFTGSGLTANFPTSGSHLLINWVDVGIYTLVGNAFTLAADPGFTPAVSNLIMDQGEHQGDPGYAHTWDVPAGSVPGDYVSTVYFFSVEVLDGRLPQPPPYPPDGEITWEQQSGQTFWVRQPLTIYKYNDLNGDGIFDGTAVPTQTGEPGLDTWNFTVTGPGGYAAWGETSGGGFLDLPLISRAGDYIITETLKTDWENTDPGAAGDPGPLQKTVTIPDDLEGLSPIIDPENPIVYFGNHLLTPDTDVDIEVAPHSLPFGGGLVTLTVRETNTGALPLHDVYVEISGDATYTLTKSGSNPPGAVFNGVDGGVPDVLDPLESWEWTIPNIPVTSSSSYTATGFGKDPSENVITYGPSHPNEIASDSVTVEPPHRVPISSNTGLGILIAGLAGIMAFVVYRRARSR